MIYTRDASDVRHRPADGAGGLLQMTDLSVYKPSDLFRTFLWHGHDFLIRKGACFLRATAVAVMWRSGRGDAAHIRLWQQSIMNATEDGHKEARAVAE
jgi:hypothetical protein